MGGRTIRVNGHKPKEINENDRIAQGDAVKFTKDMYRNDPEKRKLIIKQLLSKRREVECSSCLRTDTTPIPIMIFVCNECVEKFANRYGEVKIICKKSYPEKMRCSACGKLKVNHFQINAKLCHHCMPKMAKAETRSEKEYGERTGRIFRRLGFESPYIFSGKFGN